ncbi:uncharacterized protein BO97DRAFT_430721 [Aspergillus homomorphus CBS 101889]|uniref:Uncharacterized protein n=1 Tax=Aspergillus homomorphus (strain CBS 101889) TaxID=1450537 RepID=A0A395IDD3_ASPHC|nr:hypothetical protein BO97DRAFT_430721 [Aspergillus homomorphus CBS 101889]RAL17789.1 hypothetical protein BO97DRAFT_430721 [Aspergillus homomorphus CBS 101889]
MVVEVTPSVSFSLTHCDDKLELAGGYETQISDSAPLTEWPGTQGLSGYDEGNYLAVLFVAWAYILSARWAELLEASTNQRRDYKYITVGNLENASRTELCDVPIDLGPGVEESEAEWWNAIFSSGRGGATTTKYKESVYHSPWAVSASQQVGSSMAENISMASAEPPSSKVALEYLTRFCSYHRLYGQCLAALAGVLYMPLLSEIQYMALSSNVWGMRSLLCGTFFNADIECNLVSAWLNPAFAIIDPLRDPKLGSLWLGASLVGIVKSTLRDIRIGLTALNLNAGAWTGTEQSFLTSQPQATDRETIYREDECRLLFLAGSEGHNRVPSWPWKPFGETRLCDTELTIRRHAHCGCHLLNYRTWVWTLSNGKEIEDPGNLGFVSLNDSMKSQLLSEAATREIFGWLRSTGYPANDKPVYQHSWIDIESSDRDPMDDSESDSTGVFALRISAGPCLARICRHIH